MIVTLYHATHLKNVGSILKNGFTPLKNSIMPLVKQDKLRGTYSQRLPKLPGSLGYGTYFFSSKMLVKQFANEKIKSDFSILSIDVCISNLENQNKSILDLTDEEDLLRYLLFKQSFISSKTYREQLKRVFQNNAQSSLEGAMIEHFIQALEQKFKKKVIMVKGMTVTQIEVSKHSYVANGYEYCFRDVMCLPKDNIKRIEE